MAHDGEDFLDDEDVGALGELSWEDELEVRFFGWSLKEELVDVYFKEVDDAVNVRVCLAVMGDPGGELRGLAFNHVLLDDLLLDLFGLLLKLVADPVGKFLLEDGLPLVLLLECRQGMVVMSVIGCVLHLQVFEYRNEFALGTLD